MPSHPEPVQSQQPKPPPRRRPPNVLPETSNPFNPDPDETATPPLVPTTDSSQDSDSHQVHADDDDDDDEEGDSGTRRNQPKHLDLSPSLQSLDLPRSTSVLKGSALSPTSPNPSSTQVTQSPRSGRADVPNPSSSRKSYGPTGVCAASSSSLSTVKNLRRHSAKVSDFISGGDHSGRESFDDFAGIGIGIGTAAGGGRSLRSSVSAEFGFGVSDFVGDRDREGEGRTSARPRSGPPTAVGYQSFGGGYEEEEGEGGEDQGDEVEEEGEGGEDGSGIGSETETETETETRTRTRGRGKVITIDEPSKGGGGTKNDPQKMTLLSSSVQSLPPLNQLPSSSGTRAGAGTGGGTGTGGGRRIVGPRAQIRRTWTRSTFRSSGAPSFVESNFGGGGTGGGGGGRKNRGYDGEFREDLAGEGGNGIRVWYDSFTTIDWIHDAIKESVRLRRLRSMKGVRGWIVNQWDRFQGWLVVCIVGLFTALIATCIIVWEMWFFDIKEGYCARDWMEPKRFCCVDDDGGDVDDGAGVGSRFWTLFGGGAGVGRGGREGRIGLLNVKGVTGGGGFIGSWSRSWPSSRSYYRTRPATNGFVMPATTMMQGEASSCEHWRTWSEVFSGTAEGGEGAVGDTWWIDFGAYIFWALLFSVTAAVLTLYLSSSESVYSSKDAIVSPLDPATTEEKEDEDEDEDANVADGEGRHGRYDDEDEGEIRPVVGYGTIDGVLARAEEGDVGEGSSSSGSGDPGTSTSSSKDEKRVARGFFGGGLGRLLVRLRGSGTREGEGEGEGDLEGPKETDRLLLPGENVEEDVRRQEHMLSGKRKRKTMFYAAGSGIPEIKCILSGFVIRGYLGSWTLFTKATGLTLAVASGLSLGKEGPFVHIASCVGNIVSRFFPKYDHNEGKRREVLSAACAAGVAVSFGAPIGGVLFSLEEVSYYFPPKVMWRAFFCAMTAAVTLKFLDPFRTGKIVLFQVTYDRDWHPFELIGFLLLGLFGGIYGALFAKGNIWWAKNIRGGTWLKRHPIIEVAMITAVTVIVSWFNPFAKMGGTELVYELFSECHQSDSFDGLCVNNPGQVWPVIGSIAAALVIKGLLTIITFGIKVPAGIFIPTLAVGACAGRIAGMFVEYLYSQYPGAVIFEVCRTADIPGPLPFGQACILPGVWAMVGAAATLAGVTRMTVSLAVIMFELTGTLTYVVPVMLAVLVAKTAADAIEHRGIYDLVIELSELPFLDAKTEYVFQGIPADVVDTEALVISVDEPHTVASLRSKLLQLQSSNSAGGFPIVRSEDGGLRMRGYIAANELEHALINLASADPSTPCVFDGKRNSRAVHPTRSDTLESLESETESPAAFDFGYLTDKAPVTVSLVSPMELLQELFVKLGVRYLIVVDGKGLYRGVIEKNRWLAYLHWLEKSPTRHQPLTEERDGFTPRGSASAESGYQYGKAGATSPA